MNISRFLVILGFVAVGIASRLLPHPPNFTSINAIALFGTLYLGTRWLSFMTLFLVMFLSDLILGFHPTVPFVYLSIGFVILMGDKLKNRMSLQQTPFACAAASLLFFFVTNFGEWMMGSLYPKTITGLGLCYLAAIPFLGTQIFGDLVYGAIFGMSQRREFYIYSLLEP